MQHMNRNEQEKPQQDAVMQNLAVAFLYNRKLCSNAYCGGASGTFADS